MMKRKKEKRKKKKEEAGLGAWGLRLGAARPESSATSDKPPATRRLFPFAFFLFPSEIRP